ncbi:low molecular weight phosphotyrosine protein phosphatase-like [Agrilus planipennis]|uniref:Low molecular weight phosphotyrosine protein phosphatase-like n=1 Tax=Agrilus planipennis TaxID=224129 RepID=A0A7F5R6S0_AGRPL|nr:low molecular weight phosphotyrosine protein phosphatase-like [Agrilus planipennis]
MLIRKVLFICADNVSRSAMAEAIFRDQAKKAGVLDQWIVDSATLSHKVEGLPTNKLFHGILKQNNIKFNKASRSLLLGDYQNFDFFFGMNKENVTYLRSKAPNFNKALILDFQELDPDHKEIIVDPSDRRSLNKFRQQCQRCCKAFLNQFHHVNT